MRSHPTEPSLKANPRNTQYGLTLMKRALKEHGTRAIDRRTTLGKALDHWRDELVSDLGGREQVSTQQHAIVTLAVRTKLLLESIDAWLLQQPTLVNARKRALLPVVLQRQQLADALARYMTQLGLEKKSKHVLSLSEYLNNGKATKSSTTHDSPSAVVAQLHTPLGGSDPVQDVKEGET